MRKYTFSLVIVEGNDEFWEGDACDGSEPRGYATCEEVQALVEDCLSTVGFQTNGEDYHLRLVRMENSDPECVLLGA